MSQLILIFPIKTSWLSHMLKREAQRRPISTVLITPKNEYCPFTTRLDFNRTNNVAEYEACTMGLMATIDKRVKELKMYGDSALVYEESRKL